MQVSETAKLCDSLLIRRSQVRALVGEPNIHELGGVQRVCKQADAMRQRMPPRSDSLHCAGHEVPIRL
jgi:hypothetical protein